MHELSVKEKSCVIGYTVYMPARRTPNIPQVISQTLFAVMLPVFAVPFEFIIPVPWFVEEFAKYGMLRVIGWTNTEGKAYRPLLFGAVFGLSESLLFLPSAIQFGSLEPLLFRLFLTVPMHAVTMGAVGLGIANKGKWVFVGLAGAMLIHFLFNVVAGQGVWQ